MNAVRAYNKSHTTTDIVCLLVSTYDEAAGGSRKGLTRELEQQKVGYSIIVLGAKTMSQEHLVCMITT